MGAFVFLRARRESPRAVSKAEQRIERIRKTEYGNCVVLGDW